MTSRDPPACPPKQMLCQLMHKRVHVICIIYIDFKLLSRECGGGIMIYSSPACPGLLKLAGPEPASCQCEAALPVFKIKAAGEAAVTRTIPGPARMCHGSRQRTSEAAGVTVTVTVAGRPWSRRHLRGDGHPGPEGSGDEPPGPGRRAYATQNPFHAD